jgi:hypothetical protein
MLSPTSSVLLSPCMLLSSHIGLLSVSQASQTFHNVACFPIMFSCLLIILASYLLLFFNGYLSDTFQFNVISSERLYLILFYSNIIDSSSASFNFLLRTDHSLLFSCLLVCFLPNLYHRLYEGEYLVNLNFFSVKS